MARPPQCNIFFDASVLFSGCHSPKGASGLLLDASLTGIFTPIASRLVINETLHALNLKSNVEALSRFQAFLAYPALVVSGLPSPEEIEPYLALIADKDVHVLASAAKTGAAFLLTLDRKHFFTPAIRQARLPFSIATPGDFLKRLRRNSLA